MYVLSTGDGEPLFMTGRSLPKRVFVQPRSLFVCGFFVRYYSVRPKSHNVVQFTSANHYKLIKKFYDVNY